MNNQFDIEDRVNNFSLKIIENSDKIKKTYAGNYLSQQIVRSGISPSLNYSEVSVAESRRDFIHKMKICLKELKETRTSLKFMMNSSLTNNQKDFQFLYDECGELV